MCGQPAGPWARYWLAVRDRRPSERTGSRRLWSGCASGPRGRGLVPLNNALGDAPAGADRKALVFRPGPDVAAALTACRGPPRPAARGPSCPARMVDEGGEVPAERPGVLLGQVDLVARPVQPEPHRLLGRASVEIVCQRDGYLRCHPGLPAANGATSTVPATCNAMITANAAGRQPPPATRTRRPARSAQAARTREELMRG